MGHDHDHDHPRATVTMLLTATVILLILIAFLLGVYLYFHHGGLFPSIHNVVNVKVNTTCPLQQQPLVIPPGNGKG